MTPRSLQVGLAKWLRVTSANVVTGRAVALTIDSARTALPCGPDEAVVSAASYALGVPRSLRQAPPATCAKCSKVLDDADSEFCAVCVAAKRRAAEVRQAKRAKRSKERGPDLKPRQRPGKSYLHRDAISRAMTLKWAKRRQGAA